MNKSETAKTIVSVLLSEMRDNILREFLKFVFEEVGDKYFESPASKARHHGYPGGLSYHSSTAAQVGAKVADHYNSMGIKVNRDLVVAGLLLHDIGKIECYEWKKEHNIGTIISISVPAGYQLTHKGKMIHHIPLGFGIVQELARDYNNQVRKDEHMVGDKKLMKLLHIILSHHGRRSWSSPVIPQFTEAYIVHVVEMMDAYVEKYDQGKPIDNLYDH